MADEAATSYDSSTLLSVVLTPCPPGPEDRENRSLSSASGTTNDRVISRPSVICSDRVEEPVEHPGSELQGVDRDALVDPVEQRGEVEVGRQSQRR